ncbi:hypothetical protein L1987_24937 [Smallanthus sonchifolius]|uniref:Uncharacterized protein n=1 Tax=Smallanthus sonchifolius TaxID=185202 RepID=A0ACB9IL41_9ASTR|nr:hypothetical protein L1987_24937 [Smallanthus sonchifolius]
MVVSAQSSSCPAESTASTSSEASLQGSSCALRYFNSLPEVGFIKVSLQGLNLKLCYSKTKRRKHLEVSVFPQLHYTVLQINC